VSCKARGCRNAEHRFDGFCYVHQDQARMDILEPALDWEPSDDDAPDAPPERSPLRAVLPGERAPGAAVLELLDSYDDDVDPSLLPGPAERICREVQRTRGGPFALSGSMALGVLSTLVQGKVRFRVTPTWTEEACLYWLVFSPASASKSSSTRPILSPLSDLEDEMERNTAAPRAFALAKKKGLERKLADLGRVAAGNARSSAHQPPTMEELGDDTDWGIPTPEALTADDAMREVAQQLATLVVPESPKLTVQDINPTMLPKRLAANQRAEQATYGRVGILSTEPAFIANLMGRHTKGSPMLETVLSAYDGDKVSEDRVGEHSGVLINSTIRKPLLTIVCQGQPTVLDEMLKCQPLKDRGFLSRCIITNLADASPWELNSEPIDPAIASEWEETIRAVHAWDPCQSAEDAPGRPHEVDLSSLEPVVRELLQDAKARCAANPSETARARRAIGKALRLVGMRILFDSAPWSISASPHISASPQTPQGGNLGTYGSLLKNTYIFLYPHDNTGVRPHSRTGPQTDTHTHTHTERARRVLAEMRRCGDQFALSKTWTVSALQKALHKPSDWYWPALEELEQAGYIEHDPRSVTTYRSERRPRRFTTLSLGEVKPTAPAQVGGTDIVGGEFT
jgi:hypothetical protein